MNTASEENTETSEKQDLVSQLIEMVKEMGELFHDESDDAYITITTDGIHKTYALQSQNFHELLAHKHYQLNNRAVRAQQLTDAISTLSGCAKYEGSQKSVHLRVTKENDSYLLDLCDDKWSAIRLSAATGVEIISQPEHRFIRPKGMLPLPIPDTTGNLNDLLQLVNIDRQQATLLVAAICEFLRPDTAYPIIEFVGEYGSGKTATQAAIRNLFDPKDVPLRAPPNKEEDIFIAARNNHIVSYNNASYLSATYQDALCQLSTGGGYASRKLYSNGEEHSYNIKRPVLINGIAPVATQPDLLSRVVRLTCPSIRRRVSDTELQERFNNHASRALGYVLRTFCDALKLLPEIKLSDPPRMMDFAELGEAASRCMGNEPGAFTSTYQESLKEAAQGAIEGSPFAQRLIDYMQDHDSIEQTVGGLLKTLLPTTGSTAGWPKNARALGGELKRYQAALRYFDVHIAYTGQRREGSKLIIRRGNTPNQPSRPSQQALTRNGRWS